MTGQDKDAELRLAPDYRLDLAYNANYTQRERIRQDLLDELVTRSQRGALGRCWQCGRQTVRFNKAQSAVGPVVVAQCGSCSAWCLM